MKMNPFAVLYLRPPLFFFFFFFLWRFLLLGSVSFFHFSNNADICDNYCYTQVATNWQLQHFISFPFHVLSLPLFLLRAHSLLFAWVFALACLATGAFADFSLSMVYVYIAIVCGTYRVTVSFSTKITIIIIGVTRTLAPPPQLYIQFW